MADVFARRIPRRQFLLGAGASVLAACSSSSQSASDDMDSPLSIQSSSELEFQPGVETEFVDGRALTVRAGEGQSPPDGQLPANRLSITLGRTNIRSFYRTHLEYSEPGRVIESALAWNALLSPAERLDAQGWSLTFDQPLDFEQAGLEVPLSISVKADEYLPRPHSGLVDGKELVFGRANVALRNFDTLDFASVLSDDGLGLRQDNSHYYRDGDNARVEVRCPGFLALGLDNFMHSWRYLPNSPDLDKSLETVALELMQTHQIQSTTQTSYLHTLVPNIERQHSRQPASNRR